MERKKTTTSSEKVKEEQLTPCPPREEDNKIEKT